MEAIYNRVIGIQGALERIAVALESLTQKPQAIQEEVAPEAKEEVLVQETIPFREPRRRAKHHKWTPEENEKLIRLYNSKAIYREIAGNMGLTEGQIHGQLKKLRKPNTIGRRYNR